MPYWRLSSFYWVYYAILGAMVPFWARFFTLQGFSVIEIGSILAAVSAARVVGPNVWAFIADKTGERLKLFRLATVIGAFCFIGMITTKNYWLMLVSVFSFAFCWGAVMPQFETITMSHLRGAETKYTYTRLWGSIGYICLSIAMGAVIEHYMQIGFSLLMLTLFGLALCICFSIPIGESLETPSQQANNLSQVLAKPAVIFFLIAGLLMQISHAPFYTYFDIYLSQHGYSGTQTGFFISLGVVAEIAVFILIPKFLERIGVKKLLLICAICGVVRWCLTALYVESVVMLTVAQILHGATFGIAHAAGIYWISQVFTDDNKSRGQALYTSLTYGLGGVIGNLTFAQVWTLESGGFYTYFAAAFCCLLASIIIVLFIPRLKEIESAR